MTLGRNHFYSKPLFFSLVLLLFYVCPKDGSTSSQNCYALIQHIENLYEVTLNQTQQRNICEAWSDGSKRLTNIEDLQAEAEKYEKRLRETQEPEIEKKTLRDIENKLKHIQERINKLSEQMQNSQEERQKKLEEYKAELSDYFPFWYPGIKYHFCKDYSQLCNSIEINQKKVDDLMLKKAELIQQREALERRHGEDLRLARKRNELRRRFEGVQKQLNGIESVENRILEILESTNPTIAAGEPGILNSFQTKSTASKSPPPDPTEDDAIGAAIQ
jgi:preprotein translocase subunit SecA